MGSDARVFTYLVRVDEVVETAMFDVLENDRVVARLEHNAKQLHDVGVVQPRQLLRLVLQRLLVPVLRRHAPALS